MRFRDSDLLNRLARKKKHTSISAPGPLFRPKRPTYCLHQSEILFTEGDAVEHKNKPCLLSMSQVSGPLPSSRSRLLVARIIGLKFILFLQHKAQGLYHKKQIQDANMYVPSRSRTASEITCTAAKKSNFGGIQSNRRARLVGLGLPPFGRLNTISSRLKRMYISPKVLDTELLFLSLRGNLPTECLRSPFTCIAEETTIEGRKLLFSLTVNRRNAVM